MWVMCLHMCVTDTLSWCKHGGVQQSSLEAPASPCRQVRRVIPLLWFAVPRRPGPSRGNNSSAVWITVDGLMDWTAVMATVVMPVPVAVVRVSVFTVAIAAVCSTVYLEDNGAERDKKADADTAQKHQRCPLGLVWEEEEKSNAKILVNKNGGILKGSKQKFTASTCCTGAPSSKTKTTGHVSHTSKPDTAFKSPSSKPPDSTDNIALLNIK